VPARKKHPTPILIKPQKIPEKEAFNCDTSDLVYCETFEFPTFLSLRAVPWQSQQNKGSCHPLVVVATPCSTRRAWDCFVGLWPRKDSRIRDTFHLRF